MLGRARRARQRLGPARQGQQRRRRRQVGGGEVARRRTAGAGLQVEDVNRLLKSFEQMRKLIKQFSGPGAGKKMKRMGRMGGFGGFPGF